ncbi:MAG: glycoside hydrolase family 2 TIM barrel-domain containing protein [Nibricoccus sp.]
MTSASFRFLRLLLAAFTLHLSLFTLPCAPAQNAAPESSLAPRSEIALTDNWRTAYDETNPEKFAAFTSANFDDSTWRTVSVPHNWDDYYGFRQVKAGHLYGYAWYRTTVTLPTSAISADRRHFLFFEGVGAYATVWVNGKLIGKHGGGLTTFTLDVTDALKTDGSPNLIAVRADHPSGIRDLPWVNGGSERAYGFAEGSQPFGIHRPVRLVSTSAVRIEPFGVQILADRETLSTSSATVHARTELKNHGTTRQAFRLVSQLRDASKQLVAETSSDVSLAPGETKTAAQTFPTLRNPKLWSPSNPNLYTLTTELSSGSSSSSAANVLDRIETVTGFRTIEWRGADPKSTDGRFFINNEPFLINGTAEYEHLLGQSHAFSDVQIRARVRQIEAAGFNAFRDAHHPHNLRYADYWQRDGLLWWPQFGTHIWFDNDAFKTAFKDRLRDWIKERRNNPAVVLWALQNESRLPASFVAECVAIIREIDPTATVERQNHHLQRRRRLRLERPAKLVRHLRRRSRHLCGRSPHSTPRR